MAGKQRSILRPSFNMDLKLRSAPDLKLWLWEPLWLARIGKVCHSTYCSSAACRFLAFSADCRVFAISPATYPANYLRSMVSHTEQHLPGC